MFDLIGENTSMTKKSFRASGLGLLSCALLIAPAAFASGGGGCDVTGGVGTVQPFQFSDAFYIDHGIDPTMTADHFVFPDAKPGFDRTRLGVSPDPDVYNDVRVIETTGGFKRNGGLLYYQAPSFLFEESFTDNCAGAETRQICQDFGAFLFPLANGNPLSPAPPNRRQDNIFQTNNGYWSNNPLGCWRINFVSFDGPNVNGANCQDEMADLAEDNGFDLDGTPVITRLNDVEDLEEDGCVQVRRRNTDGSQGFPWVI